MVLQHKENFVTWDNITTEVFVGDSKWTTDSNPAEWDGGLPNINRTASVKTSSLPGVFDGSSVITLYGRIKTSGMSAGARLTVFCYDGVTYVGGGIFFNTSGFFNGITTIESATNPVSGGTTDNATKAYWATNEWVWIKCEINNTTLKLFFNDSNTTIKPSDADFEEVGSVETTIVQMGTITEIGFGANEATGNLNDSFVDDLEILVGAGIPIDNAIVDGENIKLSSVYVRKTVGQVGSSARLTYHDPLYTLGPTVETAHRTVTTISETKFNTKMLQGEIVNTDTMRREIIVNGVEAKLARTIASYDPVFMRGVVEFIDGNTMYKQPVGYEASPVFSSFGSLADKLVVFIKKHNKQYRCGIASVAYTDDADGAQAPTATSGSIANTFFLIDKEFSDSTRAYNFDIRAAHDRIAMTHEAIILDGSVINKTTLNLKIRLPQKSQFKSPTGHIPQLMIYDHTNSQFRNLPSSVKGLTTDGEIRLTSGDGRNEYGVDTGNTNVQTKVLEIVISLPDDIPTGVIADYSSVGAVNAHGFRQHDYVFAINTGHKGVSTALPFVTIEQSELRFDFDIDQSYSVGVAKIETVNDHNLVFYDNAGISWLDADIRDDGISGGGIGEDGEPIGDQFFITDKISDIIEAFWVASGMNLIMNINVTLTDEIPDIEDLRRVMILQYVQKISELLGTIYFTSYTTDPTNDLPTFNITDSPVDTGQIWTDADFVEPMRQTTYKIDSSKELSALKLIGKDGIIGTAVVTSEHTPELGLETVQISRPDIHTARQAAAWLASKKKIYTNAYRYFSCRINYDRANQDYSIADIGKLVSVKNPADGSIVDHLAGSNGKLLIYQMELNRNWVGGWYNYITFILQLRFFA